MKPKKLIELDGRTGEGGGQIVRIATALAAVTLQPLRIVHIRGNREGPRGGGLKAQHVSSMEWLAQATGAQVSGLSVGSKTLEFRPSLPPTALKQRIISISADTAAASTMLIFQAVFPYLLFAGNEAGDPIELEIHGGTNVSFSLSYEYLDQVLLPTLEDRFGIVVKRELKARGWSAGPLRKGRVWFKIQPIAPGQTLKLKELWNRPPVANDLKIKRVDVSILAPGVMHESFQEALVKDLDELFPNVDVKFLVVEESGHDARMFVLLVAHGETGLRWGRDLLYNGAWKKKKPKSLSMEISRKICKDLFEESVVRGVVDEFLEDQLVVFQALAKGRTSFPRGEEPSDKVGDEGTGGDIDELGSAIDKLVIGQRMRKDKTDVPFGGGSTHTTTARWVAAELLPNVQWFNKGGICDGAGISFSQDVE